MSAVRQNPPAGRDVWSGTQPCSDPILVVSVRAPGVRYVGRMVGGDFHVVLRHAAMAVGAENTQIYRSLERRLAPGWQVWKEAFYDNGGRRCVDCLTFSGVKAFLGCLAAPDGLPDCDPGRVRLAWPAFEGAGPEGVLYPIPPRAYDLQARHVPATPMRALLLDRWVVPVLERGDGLWMPVQTLCRWFCLSAASAGRYLNDRRGDFGEKSWHVQGSGTARQLYVPMRRMPSLLLGLAAQWRGQGIAAWERALFLAHLMEAWNRCADPGEAVLAARALPGDVDREIMELRERVAYLERRQGLAAPDADAPGGAPPRRR